MDNHKMGLVGVAAVALVLGVVAVSTDHWAVSSEGALKAHMGLWKKCVEGNAGHVCVDTPQEGEKMFPKNALMFVRLFALLGVVLMACGISCLMSESTHEKCANCLIAGGLSLELANIIWAAELMKITESTDKMAMMKKQVGWSMGLSIASGLLAIGLGVYLKMGMKKMGMGM